MNEQKTDKKMSNPLPRIKHLVNQAEIARRIGVSERYAGLLISGDRNSVKRIKQIIKIMSAEADYLKRFLKSCE